ncbi:MAG: hypothetical protein K1X86_04525 [Ignavibacteria bacterium]|nr:hypothetical protein [Ignavibacteria bacterium]
MAKQSLIPEDIFEVEEDKIPPRNILINFAEDLLEKSKNKIKVDIRSTEGYLETTGVPIVVHEMIIASTQLGYYRKSFIRIAYNLTSDGYPCTIVNLIKNEEKKGNFNVEAKNSIELEEKLKEIFQTPEMKNFLKALL